jgi:hypothetical protein
MANDSYDSQVQFPVGQFIPKSTCVPFWKKKGITADSISVSESVNTVPLTL